MPTIQKFTFRLLLVLIALCLTARAGVVSAQDVVLEVEDVEVDGTPSVADADFPNMSLTVTPLNENGVPVSGLSLDDFTLLEDGAPVDSFSVRPIVDETQGVSVMLVLDISGSMRDDLDELRQATTDLLDGFLQQTDESAVIMFSILEDGTTVDLGNPFPQLVPGRELGFSNDEGAVKNLVNGVIINEDDGTPLYDALYKGARMAQEKATKERRMVILMTDGVDSDRTGQVGQGSTVYTDADSVIDEVSKLGVPIFTVGLGDEIDRGFLQRVANATGGTFQNAPNAAGLGRVFRNIATQFKVKYVLDFESQILSDGAQHALEVRVNTPEGDASTATTFTAAYPVMPWVRGVQAANPRQDLRDLKSFEGLKGLVKLQPDVVARGDIAVVNYYVNGELVHTATETPWEFNWNTRDLEPGKTYELMVEALNDADPANRGSSTFQTPIVACGVTCLVEQQSGVPVLYWLLGLGLLLAALLAWMLLRRRPAVVADVYTGGAGRGSTAEMVPPSLPATDIPGLAFQPAVSPTVAPSQAKAKTEVLSRADVPMAFLIDPVTGRQFRVQNPMTIGSDAASDLLLDERSVSGKHAIIKLEEGQYFIQDLASTNGTLVNGASVVRQELADGDKVQLGRKQLVFKRM